MVLLVSGCAIPWYEKYKLSEEQAAIYKSTNLKGEVQIFYAIRSASERSAELSQDFYYHKPPRYGITEPHLVDDISSTQWGFFLFFPLFYVQDPDIGPHVKIEIVKKDQCYWVSEICYSTPAELSQFIVDLLQKNDISLVAERYELIGDIEKLISDAFKKEGK